MKKNKDDIVTPPEKNRLQKEYDQYAQIRLSIVNDLKLQVDNILSSLDSHPVVSGRVKNFSSFYSKYIRFLKNGEKKPQITDIMGVRVICPFIEDLMVAEDIIKRYYSIVEREIKGHYTFQEFCYESTHLLIRIPQPFIDKYGDPGTDIAEVQIRTILQDAWAEVEHELVYKAEFSPFDEPMKRKLAAVNASLSLADMIFQEIRSYQRKYSKEMEKRRGSFFQKIEESTDHLLFDEENLKTPSPVIENAHSHSTTEYNESIDDLLVKALSSHNNNQFNEAIDQYTRILELRPNNNILSIIYKHRGMANFACSCYNEAIDDFTHSLNLDKQSYKSAYYRGVVYSVMKQYGKAIDDYTLSLTINPYQSFCLFRRGQAYYHLGDFPQALSDCENSLALEPNNKFVMKFKELILTKLKM
jgi:putative GTP pyrophosphokinase